MYYLTRNIIIVLTCHVLFRVKYENLEILDKYKKCLICPNHSRIFDPIFLYPKVKNMYSMAKSDLFKYKYLSKFLSYHNVFPINREKADIAGVKKAVKLLKENDNIRLLLFPEGRVLKNKEERGIIKDGAIYIASMVEVPIIPVYITARPNFFTKVTVRFGNPIFTKRETLKNKNSIFEESKKLIKKIYNLE